MPNEKGKSTKREILAEEFANALVRTLQADDNYDKFVGGRPTGGIQITDAGDGTTRIVITLGAVE